MSENEAGGLCEALENYSSFNEQVSQEAEVEPSAPPEDTRLLTAVVEAAHLVAMADGQLTQNEADALADGVYEISESISQERLQTLFEMAMGRYEAEGADARIQAIAESVTEPELRRAILLVSSALAWRDGGVGVKQGLALQALTRAFGFSINELHKIMAQAAKTRKR